VISSTKAKFEALDLSSVAAEPFNLDEAK